MPASSACGRELRESELLVAKVGHGDGLAGLIGLQAWSLTQFGLQFLVAQGGIVRSRHIAGSHVGRDQSHPGGGDRQDIDDPLHEVIEDALNREIREHGASKLAQHARELLLARHKPPRSMNAAAGSGRAPFLRE